MFRSKPRASQIGVLALTPDATRWGTLRDIANQCKWVLFWADSCDSALSVLSSRNIAVVICDRDLPPGDWRSVLRRIRSFQQSVCILLASPVSDEYLWREVVQNEGFDVLPEPFQPERVIRMVNRASSWGAWTSTALRDQ